MTKIDRYARQYDGGFAALAKTLGISHTTLSHWRLTGRVPSPEKAQALAAAIGGNWRDYVCGHDDAPPDANQQVRHALESAIGFIAMAMPALSAEGPHTVARALDVRDKLHDALAIMRDTVPRRNLGSTSCE